MTAACLSLAARTVPVCQPGNSRLRNGQIRRPCPRVWREHFEFMGSVSRRKLLIRRLGPLASKQACQTRHLRASVRRYRCSLAYVGCAHRGIFELCETLPDICSPASASVRIGNRRRFRRAPRLIMISEAVPQPCIRKSLTTGRVRSDYVDYACKAQLTATFQSTARWHCSIVPTFPSPSPTCHQIRHQPCKMSPSLGNIGWDNRRDSLEITDLRRFSTLAWHARGQGSKSRVFHPGAPD
jgi:hypothetical protein